MAITNEQQTEILKIVAGLFNAAPGGTYLTELANLVSGGMTTSQLADALAAHSLFTGTIMAGKVTTSAQVAVLMNNFGLTADSDPASAGSQAQAYFTQQINNNVGFGKIVYDAVQFLSGSVSPEFTTAATLLSNKALVAAAYSENNSSTSLTTLQNILSTVAGAATYTDAEVQQILAGTAPTGQTFSLTTGVDLLTGSSGADSFYGSVIDNNGTGTTLNPGDSLTGGSGVDVLNITFTGSTANAAVVLQSTGVETISVGNYNTSAGADTINMAAASGVTKLVISGSGPTTFNNVASVADAEISSGTGDVVVAYASTLLTGAADSVNLALKGAGSSGTSIDVTAWNGVSTGVAETLNISSATSDNYITLNGNNDNKTINVTGDKNLSITNTLDTTVTKVDATNFTGKLSITSGVSKIDIIGGSADDTLNLAATLTVDDTVNGGAGTDTLAINDADTLSTNSAARVSNVETLRADTGDTTAYDASLIAGVTKVVANHNSNDAVTFGNMGASTELQITGTLAGDNDNVTASLKTNTTADSINVTIGTTTATSGTGSVAGTLTLDNHETINIASSGGTTAAANSIAVLTSSSATKIVVTGDRDLNLKAFTSSGTGLKTLDASAFTGKLDMDVTLTGSGITVTGGSAADTLIGGTGNDSIVGGAGNDDITSANGVDTLAGGDGDDSIAGGTGNDVITGGAGKDTITGAASNDSLDGGADDDVFVINTWSDITANDTINGGDGIDVVQSSAATITLNSTATASLANMERIELTQAGATTVTITDAGIGSFNNNITIKSNTDQSHVVNASGVLASTSKVNFTGAGGSETYNVGNGSDNASMGAGADTVSVGTIGYLSSTDTLVGGAGTSDTLNITDTVATTYTLTASQLTNVSGFETIAFDTTNATTTNYVVTLSDTILAANNNAGAFSVTRGADDDGTTKVDGSAVTASYALTLTSSADGGTPNDTLIGGAGNDVITGGAGADSLTGGAGNDTFVVTGLTQAANGTDSVTDFNFGTSSTAVDKIRFDTTSTTKVFGTASAGITAAAGTEILVLDQASYATASDAQTAARTAFGANDNAAEAIVIWQDSLGTLNVSAYADASADATANGTLQTSMVKLVGLSLSTSGSLIDATDFDLI